MFFKFLDHLVFGTLASITGESSITVILMSNIFILTWKIIASDLIIKEEREIYSIDYLILFLSALGYSIIIKRLFILESLTTLVTYFIIFIERHYLLLLLLVFFILGIKDKRNGFL